LEWLKREYKEEKEKTRSLYLLSKVVSPSMAGKTAAARRLRCLAGVFFAWKT
jgi:hypothetical protein